jgi:hypothetical protein
VIAPAVDPARQGCFLADFSGGHLAAANRFIHCCLRKALLPAALDHSGAKPDYTGRSDGLSIVTRETCTRITPKHRISLKNFSKKTA